MKIRFVTSLRVMCVMGAIFVPVIYGAEANSENKPPDPMRTVAIVGSGATLVASTILLGWLLKNGGTKTQTLPGEEQEVCNLALGFFNSLRETSPSDASKAPSNWKRQKDRWDVQYRARDLPGLPPDILGVVVHIADLPPGRSTDHFSITLITREDNGETVRDVWDIYNDGRAIHRSVNNRRPELDYVIGGGVGAINTEVLNALIAKWRDEGF